MLCGWWARWWRRLLHRGQAGLPSSGRWRRLRGLRRPRTTVLLRCHLRRWADLYRRRTRRCRGHLRVGMARAPSRAHFTQGSTTNRRCDQARPESLPGGGSRLEQRIARIRRQRRIRRGRAGEALGKNPGQLDHGFLPIQCLLNRRQAVRSRGYGMGTEFPGQPIRTLADL
jgi:hypothetical protein